MNEQLIDLVAAGQCFKKNIGPSRFAWHLVTLCHDVTQLGMQPKEKEVLVKCIVSLLNSITFWISIGPIPIHKTKIGGRDEHSKIVFLANSIVETALMKRNYLFGSSSFSHWNKNEFSQGIEWACYAIYRGVPIETSEKVPRLKNV